MSKNSRCFVVLIALLGKIEIDNESTLYLIDTVVYSIQQIALWIPGYSACGHTHNTYTVVGYERNSVPVYT